MKNFKDLYKNIEKKFDTSKGSHNFDHTKRVMVLCEHIGKKEKADLEVLKYASLLHDIAREKEDLQNGKICHAEHGAKIAKELLKEIKLSEEKKQNIVHCIATHRFRGKNDSKKTHRTKEAQILFEADKLDSIGAVGVGRAFLWAGEIGARLDNSEIKDITKTKEYSREDTAYREFMMKLRFVKSCMQTKEGKKIAKERDKFMNTFFNQLKKEVRGER